MKPPIYNRQGSILMQVLIATAIMSVGFYGLTDYVIGQKKQIGKTVNAVNLRFALNSAMDYVLFGMRQKYCFTDDDLLMNAPTDQCNLVHTGSVERLIMSGDQENFILQMIASGTNVGPVDKANIPLQSISRYIKINSATTAHPLFPVLQNLKSVKDELTGKVLQVDGISVSLVRDQSGYLPRAGREVYLKATIELKYSKTSTTPVMIGSAPLSITSQIVIYPREVGSFALLVARDLHLDTPWNATMEVGDVSLHRFASKSEMGSAQGLVFLSPVFVNEDIYLPEDKRPAGSSAAYNGHYAPVTFGDRVYLGNGWVKNANGSLFTPRSSGAMGDRYWSDVPSFGGFLRGIENDGGLDKGLQVFGKVVSGGASDTSLMSKCIERSQNLSSSNYLYKSELAGTLKEDDPNSFKYRLFLNNKNQFSGQDNPIQPVQTTNWGSGTASRKGSTGDPIMKMTFGLEDRLVTAQLSPTSTVTIVPEVGNAAYRTSLESAVTSAQNAVTLAKEKLTNLNNLLDVSENSLSKLESELRVEKAKAIEPEATPTPTLKSSATPMPSPSPSASPEDGESSGSDGESDSEVVAVAPSVTPTPTPAPTVKVDYQDPDVIRSLNAQIQDLSNSVSRIEYTDIPNQKKAITNADLALSKAKADLAILSEPAKFIIKVTPVYSKWGTYQDRVDISITASNVDHLLDGHGNIVTPSIGFLAYDGTYYASAPIKNPANGKLLRYLNFGYNSDKKTLAPPRAMAETSSSSAISGIDEDETDYAQLDILCEEARNAAASQSFGGASWNVDFSSATRSSWNFAGDSSSQLGHDPVMDKTLLLDSGADGVFKVYSIVKECVIAASANLITGFYTCDTLRIEARQKPLRIIGTFIVGKLLIDPSAYKAGITWSSIYHPQVTQELRSVGVLKSTSGASCTAPKSPLWHPLPSIQEVSDRMACNVISLRAKADPFQWTAVDPDCGLMPNSSNTTCKRRLVRFFVVEQSREGGR
jgi:hypothetical protein